MDLRELYRTGRCLGFVFVVLVIGISDRVSAQSQPPTPSPRQSGQSQQQKASPEIKKTNADGSPYTAADAFLDGVSPPPTSDEQRPSVYHRIEKAISRWTYRWGQVVSDITIAIFTGLLYFVARGQKKIYARQAEIMDKGLAETKTAADAAKLSAETADRALRLCEVAELQIIEMAFPPYFKAEESEFTFTYKNFGRSVATDVVSKVGLIDQTKPNLFATRATIAAGETRKLAVPFPANDALKVINGEVRLNATICTTYNDVFGEKQTIEFLGTYSYDRAQFEWMCSKHRMQKELPIG